MANGLEPIKDSSGTIVGYKMTNSLDESNNPFKVDISDEEKQAAIGQINSTAFNSGTNIDTNLTLDTEGGILGSLGSGLSSGLGAIKDYAKPIADLAGGFAAIGGYNEAKKTNKLVRANAEQSLSDAKYNRANKEAFDNIWKNPNLGLGKVTVS